MKENIFPAIQEHERTSARQRKFQQITDINTDSNQKRIFCTQTDICMLAVDVFFFFMDEAWDYLSSNSPEEAEEQKGKETLR